MLYIIQKGNQISLSSHVFVMLSLKRSPHHSLELSRDSLTAARPYQNRPAFACPCGPMTTIPAPFEGRLGRPEGLADCELPPSPGSSCVGEDAHNKDKLEQGISLENRHQQTS